MRKELEPTCDAIHVEVWYIVVEVSVHFLFCDLYASNVTSRCMKHFRENSTMKRLCLSLWLEFCIKGGRLLAC